MTFYLFVLIIIVVPIGLFCLSFSLPHAVN